MRIEKREAPRTMIRIQVNCECDDAFIYDYSYDMSEGGIFLSTSEPRSVGDRIKLGFILPEVLEEIEVTGEVTWVNPPGSQDLPPGMGIKFLELPEDKKELIQEVINRIEGGKGVPSLEE